MKIMKMAGKTMERTMQGVALTCIATYAFVIDPATKATKKVIDGAAKCRAYENESEAV